MKKKLKVLAFIPARGGSKGIPGKNIKFLAGIPLISHTIKAAFDCGCADKVVVSTDDEKIKKISQEFGAAVIDRPAHLAQDSSPTEPAILHALSELKKKQSYIPDVVILLQPTSPLRTGENIKEAFIKFVKTGADSLLSVSKNHIFLWKEKGNFAFPINYDFLHRPRRQEMNQYAENGAIYITKRMIYEKLSCRLGGKVAIYEMSQESSIEIDSIFDFKICEEMFSSSLHNNSLISVANKIKMVLTDVDGVLTDGGMYYGKDGEAFKKFSTLDGMGISMLMKEGFVVGIITGENSPSVAKRAEKLNIKELYSGVKDKSVVLEKLLHKYKLKKEQVAYIGDDINDLGIMSCVGMPCCPSSAQLDVKKNAKFITNAKGGEGAFRELSNLLISAKYK
ncbi:MAG: acylneuraminate cytidylyltransferase [Elusimicrobia bacterium]|nr:acylneuraminate cytidylyltransferase [Elusimicrobiota bacterium]